MPIKKNTNKLSQLYRTIDQKELSKEAFDALAKLRLATANFRKQEGKEVDAFKLFFDRLIKNKPTAVKTTPEYKAMLKERRSANGRKAMEARKAKQESRQGQGSEEDSKRPAKPFGWRLRGKHNYRKPTRADISSGRAYYEARINRADTNRTKFPMLERGGFMAKGGAIKVINISDDDKLNYFIKKQNRNSGDDSYINDMMTLDYKGKKFYSLGYDTQSGGQVFPLEEAQNNAELVLKIFRGEYDVLIKEVGGNFPDKDFVKKTYVVMTSPLFPNYMLREMKYSLKYADGGFMADGGAIKNQYKGREAEDIWNSYSKDQKYHFIDDHALQIEMLKDENYDYNSDKFPNSISPNFVRKAMLSEWKDLDEDVKNRFANHVREGQYADGGFMAKGGEIAEFRVVPMKRGEGASRNIEMSDFPMAFTIRGSKQEAEKAAQSFIIKNNETYSTAKVTKIHPSGQPLKNKIVSYVTKDEISKYEDGGFMANGGVLKQGDKIVILGTEYTFVKYETNTSQGYDEERIVLKSKDGIGSYPKDMVEAYSKYKMADGGFMANGGEVDKGGMIYALREFVSAGEIANKTDVLNYDDIAKIRRIAIQYYMDNGDVPYSYGELAKVLSYANDKFKSGMMAKGGVFYTDSHKQGH